MEVEELGNAADVATPTILEIAAEKIDEGGDINEILSQNKSAVAAMENCLPKEPVGHNETDVVRPNSDKKPLDLVIRENNKENQTLIDTMSDSEEPKSPPDIVSSPTEKIMPENIKLMDHFSSNDSSCLNSPLFVNFNGISTDLISGKNIDLLVKEYENLKTDYQTLQNDYQNSLEREKDLCERLTEYGGQGDESCNSLANINNELRTELEKVLAELSNLRSENKRLQELSTNGNVTQNKSADRLEKIEDIVKLEKIVSELEKDCEKFQTEKDAAKEKLAAHDVAAKRAITALQKEMTLRVDQVTKMHDEAVKEKDALLLKTAKFEETITNNRKKIESYEKKFGDSKKEIERFKAVLKQKDADYTKLQATVIDKDGEISKLKEEISKSKDEDSSQIVKVKWAQNKLKQELETHKETKTKLAQANAKIEEMKEEGEQIRNACQEMIKKYQNSEEMRSNQLDKELKEKDGAIKIHEHEIAVQDEINRKRTQELEALKIEHRKALGEISQMKTTVSMLEGKLSNYTIKNSEMEKRITVLSRKEEEGMLTDKLLNDANQDLKGYKEQVSYYVELEDRLRKQLLDSESEAKECKQREAELLSFTEKLTENNAHWKSQAFDLQTRVEILDAEIAKYKEMIDNSNLSKKDQADIVRKQRIEFEEAMEDMLLQTETKRKLVEELTLNLEEAQDEVKVQKRKNASTIKDLQRQLHQSKKRIDQLEECLSNSQEGIPLKSRASSNSSLDRLSNDSGTPLSNSAPVNGNSALSNPALQNPNFQQYNGEYSIVQPRHARGTSSGEIEVDKAILVDRICRLQKAHAKKNEKMEFMEEHINSLVEELKKKNKIVQCYVMREEAGTLATNKFDKNKADMSRKGGIMASVYSSRVSDKDMTLDLSLEINRKLQAVVEDMLLKNITLKESISTLGSEIARLQDDLKRARK